MKKLTNPVFAILGALILGISIGYFVSKSNKTIEQSKNDTSKSIIVQNDNKEFSLKKGGVYVKQFNVDLNDPFSQSITDTITVLDLQSSPKNSDLIYVKWTFNKWKDSTRYISTELDYLIKNIKELR
jgi:hypothetical protein